MRIVRPTGLSIVPKDRIENRTEFEIIASRKPTICAPDLEEILERNGFGHGKQVGTVLLSETAPGDFRMESFFPFGTRFEQHADFRKRGLGLLVFSKIVPALMKNGGKTLLFKLEEKKVSSHALKFLKNLGMELDVPYPLGEWKAKIGAAMAAGKRT
ncbi:hypothetical protein COU36_03465 [Candidatus Micrarchaeota archaeon CG10_big_fil_rev_8_21_14_0_10_59_7]|nr:MAG: hypothetical protein COU36_03465 [Candidatus Micrarchaeota archaeon CG10_big_fil_rev_8_21_14_0_10_59_7]